MGPPIGVDPKNATAVSASMRLRISEGSPTCMSEFIVDTIAPRDHPSGTDHKYADTKLGDHARAMFPTPAQTMEKKNQRLVTTRSRAIDSDPRNEPALMAASIHPNERVAFHFSSKSFGNTTA
jgi:hypothetical protein